MWASRRSEAARRFTELSHRAATARADAHEARLAAAEAGDDAESRSSLERSAAKMDEAAADLERIAERYLAMWCGDRTAADVDDLDDTAWDSALDPYELASWDAFPPVSRALTHVRTLDGMAERDIEIDDVVYTGEGAALRLWPSFMTEDRMVVLRVDDDGSQVSDRYRRPISDHEAAARLRVRDDTFTESRTVLAAAMVQSRTLFSAGLERHEAANARRLPPVADGEEDVSW